MAAALGRRLEAASAEERSSAAVRRDGAIAALAH
jgi:hypothetical protein